MCVRINSRVYIQGTAAKKLAIDIASVGMRTKASVVAEKRRKVGNGEPKSPFSQITTEKETETGTSAGDHNVVSCFSVNGSTEELEFADLKVCV